MRILFLTDKFLPERGGSQIIFGNLYAHLAGHEVTIVTRRWPGDRECDAAYPHRIVRVPYLAGVPKLRTLHFWAGLHRAARSLLAREPYDQVHCGQPLESAPIGTRLARRWGLPSLVHTFAEDVTTFADHPLFGPPVRAALRRAAAVTTISRFTRERLCSLGVDEKRIVLLYPGVTAEHWRPTGAESRLREELGLQGCRVLLTVSRLIPRKGHDTVLRALPRILERFPEVVYLIVGEGPAEPRLRALAAELGLERQVRFVGSIDNRRTVDYYHAADLFVMPNRRMPNGDIEGFGLVFLEANACGLPVIGGRSGGTPDAIEDGRTGFLVSPDSVEEVAGRVLRLLCDPAGAQAMGEAGRRRVLEEFTWAGSGRVLGSAIALASGEPASASGPALTEAVR